MPEQEYSREKLLKKLQELVDNSFFLPSEILEKAKDLNQESLENLVITVWELSQDEKSLTEDQKKLLTNVIIKYLKKKEEVYAEGFKQFMEEQKEKQNEEDEKKEETLEEELKNI